MYLNIKRCRLHLNPYQAPGLKKMQYSPGAVVANEY